MSGDVHSPEQGRDEAFVAFDQLAKERDRLADERDAAADARELAAGFPHTYARLDREHARLDREQAAADRARAARAADAAEELESQLRQAMETRGVIGQAQGLLMARYGIGPEEAFGLLVKRSQDTNTKLHDIAERLVAEATS